MDNTTNRNSRTTAGDKSEMEAKEAMNTSMTTRTPEVISSVVDGNDKLSQDIFGSVKASASQRETVVVPVHEEELIVKKRQVESGRVAVNVQTTIEQQVIDVPLSRDYVEVERIPINRVVSEVTPPREEGDVTVIPVFEEVLVVEKRLVLKEEIRMTRRRTTESHQQTLEVRKQVATVTKQELNSNESAT